MGTLLFPCCRTRNRLIYATKYAGKEGSNGGASAMFDEAAAAAAASGKGSLSACHKFFNKCVSCSDMICALEVKTLLSSE